VTNAYQAIGSVTGDITLRLGCAEKLGVERDTLGEMQAHETIVVDVQDSGPGIPATIRERIFDPFFTTKTPEGGTGLGLSTSHQIISAHGGKMVLLDTPGGGATFRILLPSISHGAGPTRRDSTKVLVKPKQGLSVWVVDDEFDMGQATAGLCEVHGAQVKFFDNPMEASEASKNGALQEVDVFILDHAMPKMLGTELASQILERKPSAKIVLLTGNVQALKKGESALFSKVMQKPLGMDEIGALLAEMAATP
ncbi:MAG: response regulator, partial [Planctomycetes bacterium]|nr:response regulator [Planctomycetota bacterium]